MTVFRTDAKKDMPKPSSSRFHRWLTRLSQGREGRKLLFLYRDANTKNNLDLRLKVVYLPITLLNLTPAH